MRIQEQGLNNQAPAVTDGMLVSFTYVLHMPDGEDVERTDESDPIRIVQGRGQIVAGLEDALYGMRAGEERAIIVDPEEGYGVYDDENLDLVPRSLFPDELELTVGKGLRLRDRDSGEVYTAYVADVNEDTVILDFNHPLAGETLHFHVRIVDVREATDEETPNA